MQEMDLALEYDDEEDYGGECPCDDEPTSPSAPLSHSESLSRTELESELGSAAGEENQQHAGHAVECVNQMPSSAFVADPSMADTLPMPETSNEKSLQWITDRIQFLEYLDQNL